MIIKRNDSSSIASYLGQFDLHNHSFSHCVFEAAHTNGKKIEWDKTHLDEKIDFIIGRLKAIMQTAMQNNVRVLGITEHTQYTKYNVPYSRYKHIFQTLRSQFEGFIDKMVWGLEIDLQITEDKKPFINEDEIGNQSVGAKELLLYDADIIIGSMHPYKPWKYDQMPNEEKQKKKIVDYDNILYSIKSCDDYFELTINALKELGSLRRRLDGFGQRKKAFVYGHPWGAAWMANKRAYEHIKCGDKDIRMNKDHPLYNDFQRFLWGPTAPGEAEAPIKFFTHDQLVAIADAHIDNGIYPEVNCNYIINRGASECMAPQKLETLLSVYLRRCMERNVAPYISVGSDAHAPSELRAFDLQHIVTKDPSLTNALVWAETIS
ncbi:MAG: hypothetical protein QXM31_03470 [Candidatus Woesearchaeota archaeon]